VKKEPEVNLKLAIEHGLNEEEYTKILDILGRVPTYTELGIFSVMWSEHCSYKNSLLQLKTLPREGKNMLVGAGEENAGLIDIGDELAIAFKIESHNHPSAVEPYQGAATGVGGIMRDIFTMGARPIAALDSLRFGELNNQRNRYLFSGVVKGIGDYGNCLGIPTVAGEVYFEDCYSDNCLVNAMTVGIVKKDLIARARVKSPGASVYAIGSSTGRDGIHGATFASVELSEASESKRSSVQVGDPFTEKLLLEVTLELIKEDIVEGIQDMGAAGLTSSSSEISANSKLGIEIRLDQLHLREKDMIPYEIMLSESQERMLVICKPGTEQKFEQICRKWDLDFSKIGRVTEHPNLKVFFHSQTVADIPSYYLSAGDGAPVYKRETSFPAYLKELQQYNSTEVALPADLEDSFRRVFASPNIVSKQWVYEQYDYMVRTNTVIEPGSDAAVIRIKGSNKAIAMKTDCNGRYVYLSPRRGAAIAVAESARNVVCSGAKPVAITNCLNFGNPYKPEIYWQFTEAVAGIGDACRILDTPVTGGNVSFYNESEIYQVYPTPVIGMIGIIESLDQITPSFFQAEGDLVYIVGTTFAEIGGSEYLKVIHGKVAGMPPELDLHLEKRTQDAVLAAIREGLIKSAHDVADGGVVTALAECCIGNMEKTFGLKANLLSALRADILCFSESQSRFVLSISAARQKSFEKHFAESGIPVHRIGQVGGQEFRFNNWLNIPVRELSDIYFKTLPGLMQVL
jgi:phosphoribosylformylglycinamidine synthase subunit PurL